MIRYVVPGMAASSDTLTARELRDWQGRIEIGRYIVRPVDGNHSGSGRDAWNLFVRTVVGTRDPVDTDAFVDEFATLREAVATARRLARKEGTR